MAKIVAIGVVAVSLLGGAGAGQLLKPVPPPEEGGDEMRALETTDFLHVGEESVVTLRDAFIVPILRDGMVWSHVILTLGVSAEATSRESILLREPILRDALTETLFVHGSLGGFDGDFTEPRSMGRLRQRLDDAVKRRLDDPTARVLIVSVARQGG